MLPLIRQIKGMKNDFGFQFIKSDKFLPGPAVLALIMLDYVNLETGEVFSTLVCVDENSPYGWFSISLNQK